MGLDLKSLKNLQGDPANGGAASSGSTGGSGTSDTTTPPVVQSQVASAQTPTSTASASAIPAPKPKISLGAISGNTKIALKSIMGDAPSTSDGVHAESSTASIPASAPAPIPTTASDSDDIDTSRIMTSGMSPVSLVSAQDLDEAQETTISTEITLASATAASKNIMDQAKPVQQNIHTQEASAPPMKAGDFFKNFDPIMDIFGEDHDKFLNESNLRAITEEEAPTAGTEKKKAGGPKKISMGEGFWGRFNRNRDVVDETPKQEAVATESAESTEEPKQSFFSGNAPLPEGIDIEKTLQAAKELENMKQELESLKQKFSTSETDSARMQEGSVVDKASIEELKQTVEELKQTASTVEELKQTASTIEELKQTVSDVEELKQTVAASSHDTGTALSSTDIQDIQSLISEIKEIGTTEGVHEEAVTTEPSALDIGSDAESADAEAPAPAPARVGGILSRLLAKRVTKSEIEQIVVAPAAVATDTPSDTATQPATDGETAEASVVTPVQVSPLSRLNPKTKKILTGGVIVTLTLVLGIVFTYLSALVPPEHIQTDIHGVPSDTTLHSTPPADTVPTDLGTVTAPTDSGAAVTVPVDFTGSSVIHQTKKNRPRHTVDTSSDAAVTPDVTGSVSQ